MKSLLKTCVAVAALTWGAGQACAAGEAEQNRSGPLNVPNMAALGLGAAIDHALEWGMDRIEATVTARADQLRAMLAEAGFSVFDEGVERCGIVTTATPSEASEHLVTRLAEHRINATTTDASSSRWDVERRNLPVLLRLSVHCTTTDGELERAVEVLRR